jgi:hypothetical protein
MDIDITAILIVGTLFGVLPISITGMTMFYRLKMQQMKQGKILSPQELDAVKELAATNQELRKRIENMELIMHESKLLSADDKKNSF